MRFVEIMQSFVDLENVEFISKVFLSTICGVAIGFERKMHTRNIGMKTNFLICTGSMLFADLGFELAKTSGGDPSRVTSQIVTGVGFLGAGAIMRGGDLTVLGLTSAAVVWVNAAIGCAIGLGYYAEAFYFTLSVLLGMAILKRADKSLPSSMSSE